MSMFQEPIASDPSDLVVSEQSRIFVSTDGDGDVVIHQYCRDRGDSLIYVCPQNALALSRAILKAAGVSSDATTGELTAKRTAANERQRRHREKLRDCHGQKNVTVTKMNEVDGYHEENGFGDQ
ncbi:hypothetical protein ACFIOY_29030 [Bradyrhizobium sp. TZ2]